MSRHECKGEGCGLCAREIAAIEDERAHPGPDADVMADYAAARMFG